jgi:uncharacterized membrane protein YdfJ with MMPL/SSD domain
VDSAIASVIVAFIASIGGILIAVIQKSRKENKNDHNMVKECIDLLRDDVKNVDRKLDNHMEWHMTTNNEK